MAFRLVTQGFRQLGAAAAGSLGATTFTGDVTMSSGKQLLVADGTVGAPGLAFASDPDCGLYRTGANVWSIAAGGAQSAEVQAALISVKRDMEMAANRQLLVDDGVLGGPGLAFRADPDTGLYRIGADALSLVQGSAAFDGTSYTDLGTLVAGTAIAAPTVKRAVYLYTCSGSITLTATPTIANGTIDGQVLYLVGATTLSGTVTWQDETGLAGSNMRFPAGAAQVMGSRDTIILIWVAAIADWVAAAAKANN